MNQRHQKPWSTAEDKKYNFNISQIDENNEAHRYYNTIAKSNHNQFHDQTTSNESQPPMKLSLTMDKNKQAYRF